MLLTSFSIDKIEAGTDEAGRGCLAGPVTAATVILPKDYCNPDLNDSKQLTKKKREKLRAVIEQDAMAWAVAHADNTEIDKVNILNASYLAMHRAIDKLNLKPQLLLIDGNRFNPFPGIPHRCIVKGDSKYQSIAAASILAKCYRDDFMRELSSRFPDYTWETNVGYPTIKHRQAIKSIGITPFHRKSFQLLPSQLELFEDY